MIETLDETFLVNGGVILKKEDEILESELSRQFHLNTSLEDIRARYERRGENNAGKNGGKRS